MLAKKFTDGTMVSAKCGGWGGQCRHVREMLLEHTPNALFYGLKWKIYIKDGPSLPTTSSLLPAFHLHYLLKKHGQLTVYWNFLEVGDVFLFDKPLPLGFFVFSPVYRVVTFKMADIARPKCFLYKCL